MAVSSSPNVVDLGMDESKGEWRFGIHFMEYNGFFYRREILAGVKAAQTHFQPRPDDVFLCGSMKTGTTWLKAIVAAILSSNSQSKRDLLSQNNPHDLIPNIEIRWRTTSTASALLDATPFKPRVLQTHVPYSALPPGIRSLGCRIIYLARNPKDTFVSFWQFMDRLVPDAYDIHGADTSLEAVFDAFCTGVCQYGPFCDHVLSFWNAAKNNPKILFLSYEDMKADNSASYIRRIGDFLGRSCLTDEEVKSIYGQCRFESLSALEVNRTGKLKMLILARPVENTTFFRKGIVGDWQNYLTADMNSRLESMVEKKLEGSDFRFRYE